MVNELVAARGWGSGQGHWVSVLQDGKSYGEEWGRWFRSTVNIFSAAELHT